MFAVGGEPEIEKKVVRADRENGGGVGRKIKKSELPWGGGGGRRGENAERELEPRAG